MQEECEYCAGMGVLECMDCDAAEGQTCPTCWDTGTMECPDCDGNGEIYVDEEG